MRTYLTPLIEVRSYAITFLRLVSYAVSSTVNLYLVIESLLALDIRPSPLLNTFRNPQAHPGRHLRHYDRDITDLRSGITSVLQSPDVPSKRLSM